MRTRGFLLSEQWQHGVHSKYVEYRYIETKFLSCASWCVVVTFRDTMRALDDMGDFDSCFIHLNERGRQLEINAQTG